MPEVLGQVERRAVPVGGALTQGLEANAVQLLGDGAIKLAGRPGLPGLDLFEHAVQVVRLNQPLSRKQLVENGAQAVDIRATIDAMSFAACLLGAHVHGGACKGGALAEVLFAQGHAKVGDERTSFGVEQDVSRLDVANRLRQSRFAAAAAPPSASTTEPNWLAYSPARLQEVHRHSLCPRRSPGSCSCSTFRGGFPHWVD